MFAEDCDIPVLSHFEASHDLVHTELNSGIEGDEFKRLLFAEASVLYGFGRIVEQAPDPLSAVGVDGHKYTLLGAKSCAVGYALGGFILVSPAVGKNGGSDTVGGQLLGDLEAL